MIDVRLIQAAESSQAKALVASVMRAEFANAEQAYPIEDLEDIQRNYRSVGEAFFVAVDKGQIVGTLGVKRETERTALLRRLIVSPDYRSRGIGQKLLERAIQFCREAGYHEILVKTSSAMDRAIELCRKAGFQERGHVTLGPVQLFRYIFFIKENSPLQALS